MKTLNLTEEEGAMIVSCLALAQMLQEHRIIKLKEGTLTQKEVDFLMVRIVQEMKLEETHPELSTVYKLIEKKENERAH